MRMAKKETDLGGLDRMASSTPRHAAACQLMLRRVNHPERQIAACHKPAVNSHAICAGLLAVTPGDGGNLCAGAAGYILKSSGGEEIAAADRPRAGCPRHDCSGIEQRADRACAGLVPEDGPELRVPRSGQAPGNRPHAGRDPSSRGPYRISRHLRRPLSAHVIGTSAGGDFPAREVTAWTIYSALGGRSRM